MLRKRAGNLTGTLAYLHFLNVKDANHVAAVGDADERVEVDESFAEATFVTGRKLFGLAWIRGIEMFLQVKHHLAFFISPLPKEEQASPIDTEYRCAKAFDVAEHLVLVDTVVERMANFVAT